MKKLFALLAVLSNYIQDLNALMIGNNFSFLALNLLLTAVVFLTLIWVKPITEEIKRKEHKISVLRNIESEKSDDNS